MTRSRRQFLRAAGVSLALPGLERSSAPASTVPAGMNAPGAEPPAPPKPDPPKVVEITARLDKHEAHPGEVVRLTEVVPAKCEIEVRGMLHHVYRIGHYDLKLERLIYRDRDRFLYATVTGEFRGGFGGLSTRPIPFDVTNPREKGFEFEFKPRYLGIYLIDGEWIVQESRTMNTQPVVLVVSPPLDENGKPVVKPEWLHR